MIRSRAAESGALDGRTWALSDLAAPKPEKRTEEQLRRIARNWARLRSFNRYPDAFVEAFVEAYLFERQRRRR